MDTNTNAQSDLISLKNSEYSNFPGLVLGLDGWILRSLPVESREAFLKGYERLLKIVFHPDRFQDPAVKLSRQTYLQNVGEAIRFMLSDAFAYEMTTETVPTRKNPLVILNEAIAARDKIISRVDSDLDEKSKIIASLREEVEKILTRLSNTALQAEQKETLHYRLTQAERKCITGYPVPIGVSHSLVRGNFFDVKADSEFAVQLAHYSSEGVLNSEHEWLSSGAWIKSLSSKPQGELVQDMAFRRRLNTDKTTKITHTIVGAMSIVHFCEWLRHFQGYPKQNLGPGSVIKAVRWLTSPMTPEVEKSEFLESTRRFTLPYFSKHMILLMRVRTDKKLKGSKTTPEFPARHKLFAVRAVDAGENPLQAKIEGLERELKERVMELSEIRGKCKPAPIHKSKVKQ